MILCQSCLKKLENRFETERQLCHKCKVIAEAEWNEAFKEEIFEEEMARIGGREKP